MVDVMGCRLTNFVEDILVATLSTCNVPAPACAVSNTVRAWGAAFSFCTDHRIFRQLDSDVAEKVVDFLRLWRAKTGSLSATERQCLLGMHLLDDTEFDTSFAELVASRAGTQGT
jgi:hypothetical protein